MGDRTSKIYRMWKMVKAIPKGKVTSYGQLAREVGVHPRVIGRWLHKNESPEELPCHRVIKSDGTIASGYAFGGEGRQREILESEGVKFDQKGKVLAIHRLSGWNGEFMLSDEQPM